MRPQPVTASPYHRIVAGLPFVEALARRMASSMPNSIDLGDLVQDGVIGLIDAAHRFDEAIDWYKKARELDPNFALVRGDLINALLEKGSDDEAIAEILESRAASGATPESLAALKQAYAAEGIKGYWRSERETLEKQLAAGRAINAWRAARVYAALGEHDRAFDLFDKAYDERTSLLTFIKTVPVFDVLHSDRRFAALLRRMGL